MRFFGISGSLRTNSFNRQLLEAMSAATSDQDELAVFDQAKAVPVFDEDLEAQGAPPSVAALQDGVRMADVVIIATPEYNQSLPRSTKNLLDWISRDPDGSPLIGKLCAVTGVTVGHWGTRVAQSQLILALHGCGAEVLAPRHFVAKAGQAVLNDDALASFLNDIRRVARDRMSDIRLHSA